MKAYTYIILMAFAATAMAKLDPSTSVLVKRAPSATVEEVDVLDTTRYEVRPVQVQPVQVQSVQVQPVQTTPITVKKVKVNKAQLSADQAVAKTSNTSAAAGGVDVETEQIKVIKVQAPAAAPPAMVKKVIVKEDLVEVEQERQEVNYKMVRLQTAPTTVPLSQQLQIFLLGDPQEIEAFREQLHPLDSKNNKIEIALAPYYFYKNSQSNYWYNTYNFGSLGFAGDLRGWITPFFGLRIAYQSSLGASVSGTPTGNYMSPVSWTDVMYGIRFRKFFGSYRKAPQLQYTIDYVEDKVSPTGDLNQRLTTKTTGVRFGVEATLPSTLAYSQLINFSFVPRPGITQSSPNGSISSGSSAESYILGLAYGGLYNLDRYHQLFWRIDESFQKTTYGGSASTQDPMTATIPSRVSVTDSTTMFYIGIQFGQ